MTTVGFVFIVIALLCLPISVVAADRARYHKDRALLFRACARLTLKRLELEGDASAGAGWALAEIGAVLGEEAPPFLDYCRREVGMGSAKGGGS